MPQPLDRYLSGEISAGDLLAIDSLDMARLAKLGVSCLEARLVDQARATFRLMARLRPDCFLVHAHLGMVAEADDDLLSAKEAYERAGTLLEAEGELPPEKRRMLFEIVLLLACVLIRLGHTEQAIEYLTELEAATEAADVQLEAQQLLMGLDGGRGRS